MSVDISNVTLIVNKNEVTIEWDTTEFGTSTIEYGTSVPYSNTTNEEPYRYYHRKEITGLASGSIYFFKITSVKYNKSVYVYEGSFTTLTQTEYENIIKTNRSDGQLPKTYYVNNVSGNDIIGNGSIITPFGTPQYAVSLSDCGDIIYVMATGTAYSGTIVFPRSGIDIAPITLQAYGGTIDFDNINFTGTLFSISSRTYLNIIGPLNSSRYAKPIVVNTGSSHIYASDINSLNSGDTGVSMQMRDGVHHSTFERCTVNGTPSGANAIMIFGSDYPGHNLLSCHHNIIKDCEVFKAPGHNGIDIHTNNQYINIEGCYIHNVGDNCIYIHAVQSHDKYITCRDNIVHDYGMNGIYVYSSDILLDGNTVSKNYVTWRGGIALFTAREAVQINSFNLYALNNITYDCYNGILVSNYDSTYLDTVVLDGNVHGLPWTGNASSVDVRWERTPITNSIVRNIKGYNGRNTVKYYHSAGQNIPYEWTDGRIVKPSTGIIEYTNTGSKMIAPAGTTTYTLYDMTCLPTNGIASVNVTKFDLLSTSPHVIANVSNTVTNDTINFSIYNLSPLISYAIKISGTTIFEGYPNANGIINFNYSDWTSSKIITLETGTICPVPICHINISQI